jgi:hypothetical protein
MTLSSEILNPVKRFSGRGVVPACRAQEVVRGVPNISRQLGRCDNNLMEKIGWRDLLP